MTASSRDHITVRAGRSRVTRLSVHLGLILTVVVSLVFEPLLTVHVVVGLAFLGLVGVHLAQRRRVSTALARRLADPAKWLAPSRRLALADAALAALTLAMVGTGLWDWLAPRPTRIRWHALTGVALTFLLLLHTVRRWRRLRNSHVR